MKKILSAFLLLLTLCSLLTLASCDILSKITGGEDNVGELDTYYEAYKLYAEAKGETPLSYEIWLGSVNGAADESGRTPEYKLEENEFFVSYDEGESWLFIGNVQIYGVTGEITAPSVKFQDGELYISDNSGDSWSSIGAIGNIQAPTQNEPDTPNHEHTFVNGECECGEKEPGYEPPHEHIFVNGKCECGEADPEYVPPHEHNFVNGKCECGEADPEYVPPHEHIFVNGKCECGEADPEYVPPHEHNFVNGKCECGEADPEYVPPHEHIFIDGKCECGEVDPEYIPEFPDITLRNLSINAPAAIVLDEGSFIGDTVDLLNSYGVLIICTYNDGTDYYLPIDPEMIYTDLNTDIPGSYTITLSVTYEGRDAIATINVIVNDVYSEELTDEDRTNLVNELYSRYGEIVGLTQIPEEMAIELDELATRARSLTTHAEAEEWKHEANDYINRISTYINFCSKGHTFTGYVSNNDATCSSDGTETSVCMFCTATDTRIKENSRLPHSYTEDVISPTCTVNGSVTYTCSVCSYSYVDNESLPAKGHSYTEAITPPSCTEQGYTTYTCSDCSDSYIGEDRIPANGHSFVDGFCSVCKDADPDYTPFDLEAARAELISELEGKKTFYVGEGGTLPTELENEYLELFDRLKAAADEDAINAWRKDAEPFFSELESALGACRDGHTIILDESNNYKPLCTECGVTYTIITLVGETPVRVKQYSVIESAAAFLTENGLKLRYTYNDGSVRILPIEENEVTGSIDTSEPGIIGVLINKRTAVGYSRITVEIEVVESDEPAPDTPTPDEPTTDENFIPVVPEDIKYGEYYMFSTPGVVCVRLVQYPDGMHVFFGNDMENSHAVYSQYEFVDGVIVTVSDDILPLVFYLDHENMQARFYRPSGESKTFTYTPAENTYCTFTLYGMDKNEGYAYTVYKTRTGNTEAQMTINMKYNLTDNTLYAAGTTFYILDDNTLSTTPPGYVPITNAYLSGATEAEIEQFTEIGSVADLLGELGAYITYEYSDGTTSTGPITENMVSATPIDTSEPGTVSVLIKVTVDSGETFTSYFKIIITGSSSEFEDIKTEYAIRYEELWRELMDEQGYEILEPYDMTYSELIVALWDSETVEQAEEALIGLEGLFDRIYKELGLYEDITGVNVNKNSITVDEGTSLDEILDIVVEDVFLNVNGKEVPLTRDMVRASEGAPEIIPAGGYIYISINYTQYNVSYGLSVVVYGVCDLSNEKLIGNFIFVGNHPLITGIEIYESDISVLHLLDMDDMQVISRAEDGIVVLSVIYFSDNIVLYYDLENGTCDFLSYESEDEIIEVIDYQGSTLTVFGEYTGPGIYFAERSGIGDTTTIEIYYNKEDRMITVTGHDYIILEDGTVEACVTEEEVTDFVGGINDYFYNILPSVGADIAPYEEEFILLRDSVYSIVLETEFWNLQNTMNDFLNSIPQGVI